MNSTCPARSPRFFTVIAVTTTIAVCLAFLPAVATAAQTVPKARGAESVKNPAGLTRPRPYYAPDAVAGFEPVGEEFAENVARMCPPEWLPASLVSEQRDESRIKNSSARPSGEGTGGWTPIARPYTPSTDPAISYGSYSYDTLDSSGRQHVVYFVTRNTDVSQAPDAPGTVTKNCANLYYTVYTEGSFSTPVQLTSFTGLDDTSIWDLSVDSDDYLHLIYSKWTWGRDSSMAPGLWNAYQHEGESVYYRYCSPDGVWSSPRCLADFSGAAWAVPGAEFYLQGDRLYGAWLEILNKETAPVSTYTGRVLFIDGVKDDWGTPYTIKAWDYSDVAGQQEPYIYPTTGTSPVTGEVTLAFSLRTIGALPDQHKIDIYGTTRNPAGSWSTVQNLTSAAANEGWFAPFILYSTSGTTAEIWAYVATLYTDALLAPMFNMVLIRHSGAGWQAPINITRAPAGKAAYAGALDRDPFGSLSVAFLIQNLQWNPAAVPPGWSTYLGDEIQYTYETSGGFSDPETVLAYQAGRYTWAIDGRLDGDGHTHLLFETHFTNPYIGTGYGVYYTNNKSGTGFSSPQKISMDTDRVVESLVLTCRPNGDVLASWLEVKADYVTGEPKAGAIYSRCMRGGSWGAIENITAVPGSDEIMHVEYSVVGGYFTNYQYYDFSLAQSGEQRLIFETARYNTGTATYYDFKKYYTESRAGSWGDPERVLQIDLSGDSVIYVDANERVTARLRGTESGKNVYYYSMQRSPTPPAYTYFFAEGTTRPGFQEWISLQNPGEQEANVTITYMLGTGENRDQSVVVSPHSRLTVDVNTFVGADQDVSARVSSDQLIVAERPMYFDYRGWTGGDDAVGSIDTGRVWYFAEGTTRSGFQEWLTLQNPSDYNTTVDITYMLGDGSTMTQQVPVAARTRATVDVNAFVGPEQDVSMKVESPDAGIVAERPMYFDYHGYAAGGHNVVGSLGRASRWYFAEGTTRSGFDTYLCLQNPNSVSGSATITYILGDGSTENQTLSLPATSRQTVRVSDIVGTEKDVSIVVDANTLIIAERPMYFDYHGFAPGGHNAMGAGAPKNSWFFAEGTTRPGFEEWLSLENPGVANANVTLRYMLGDGSVVPQNVSVPAHTRVTVDVNTAVGPGQDVSVSVWSDQGIVAERPMYFNYQGVWPGGSDVMGL